MNIILDTHIKCSIDMTKVTLSCMSKTDLSVKKTSAALEKCGNLSSQGDPSFVWCYRLIQKCPIFPFYLFIFFLN